MQDRRYGLHLPAGLTILAALFLGACSSGLLEVYGAPSRTFSLVVGEELSIRLQSIGPGEFSSPPTLTGSAVEFLEVSDPGIAVPAGVTQAFRFKAVAVGDVVIRFHHTGNNPTVQDTVIVQGGERLSHDSRSIWTPSGWSRSFSFALSQSFRGSLAAAWSSQLFRGAHSATPCSGI